MPEARAVEVRAEPETARGVGDILQDFQWPDRAARPVMGVFGGEQPGHRIAGLRHHGVRRPDRGPDLFGRKDAPFPLEAQDGGARERRGAAALHQIGVGAPFGEDQIPGFRLAPDRDLVAHRSRGSKDRGVLPEDLGGAFFETADRGVVAVHVVSNLGGGHGGSHLRGRERDGVAAKINPDRASGGGLGHLASSWGSPGG